MKRFTDSASKIIIFIRSDTTVALVIHIRQAVDDFIELLLPHLENENSDIIIDGGRLLRLTSDA
ncbi:MAG: hypothetical protein KKE31_07200 [Planctomycetes bacterium]|nr:hypothetical protein [Planctomycetota bacterium]MBU1518275.1 hypothetical protein [Planctomycetota bacterium]MBU2458395.1 hypothetical protein [Planctomycetota bacterium]